MPGIGRKPIGSYDGLLNPTQIHASSTRLGWQGITVNNDVLPAGFQPGKKQAFRDHHLVVNIGEDRKSFCCSVDGLGNIPVKVMRPWDFIFVPAGTIWDWKINSTSQILSIRLQSEILDAVALHAELGSGRYGCKISKIVEIAQSLKDELEQPTEFTLKATEAYRTLLAIDLVKHFAVAERPAMPTVAMPNEGGIAAALALIDAWVESPGGKPHPDIDELADAACMSRRTLQRHFQRVVKDSPHQFVLRRAMEKAATLLPPSRQTRNRGEVKRAALLLGYNPEYFSRRYKSTNGHAPSKPPPRG